MYVLFLGGMFYIKINHKMVRPAGLEPTSVA